MNLDKLIASDLAHGVHWFVNSHGVHSVHYHKQVNTFSGDRADVEAAKEYGLCIRHSLDCEGAFDN